MKFLDLEPKSTNSLRSACLFQMLNGLGLQFLALKQPGYKLFRLSSGSLLVVGATLLPSTIFFRYLLRDNLMIEPSESSLELSKVGGLSTFIAWLLLILN
jgi:uncharacterized membrane protein YgdD (TMEM256/DUF423 family)